MPASICVAFCCGALAARAAVPGLKPDQLKEKATYIVVGKVTGIYSSASPRGDKVLTTSVAQIEVEDLEKGNGLNPGDLVYARYYKWGWAGKGPPVPGSTDGHFHVPRGGDRVRVYLEQNFKTDRGYNVLFPNGFEILNPEESQDTNESKPVRVQHERFVQVQNDTGLPLTLWVQVRTRTDDRTWTWLPADPRKGSRSLAYNLKAGQKTYLAYQHGKLKGSCIRFWVKSEAGEWTAYRDRALWLVPELDEQGNHAYQAEEIETFPLRLSP
jgi:hypothetical protein